MSKMIKAFTRKMILRFKTKCECVLLLNCHKSHTRADAFIYYHSCFQKPFLLLKHSRPLLDILYLITDDIKMPPCHQRI